MTTPSSLGEQIKAQVKMFAQFSAREGMDVFTMQSLARTEFLALVDALVSLAEASTPAREAGAVGGWISVDESLPTKFEEVLISFKGSTLAATGQYTGNKRDSEDGWCYPSENSGDETDWTVTHWQPLPPAPLYTQEKAE
jgi:hypothetical protein